MKIKINLKGMSNKKRNIRQIEYEYRDECFEIHDQNTKVISVRDFLAETVRLTIAEYQKAAESIEALDESDQNRICKKENPESAAFMLMKALAPIIRRKMWNVQLTPTLMVMWRLQSLQ